MIDNHFNSLMKSQNPKERVPLPKIANKTIKNYF